jgi:Fic family protein
LVSIHPFLDGNGRAARLWQTRLLMEVHPVFEFLDVESMVFERRAEYYEQIRTAQESGDASGFAVFMFEQIARSLSNLWKNSDTVSRDCLSLRSLPRNNGASLAMLRWKNRLETARGQFGSEMFSRKDYLMLFKTIAPITASRDLAAGVEAGQLTRQGDKRTAVYRFV